jgi:TetR/AcrR family transcriptional repressor of nem operon
MRYPDTHKAEVKEKIVRAAARLFRRDGLEAVSIPSLMKEVGLTHGGFYNHFEDRDALVAEALLAAAHDGAVADESRSFEATVRDYLSEAHAQHPELGCVLAALGSDAVRQGKGVRRTFAEVARGFFSRIEAKRLGATRAGRRTSPTDETLAVGAQLVGAVLLARLVDDPELAKRILAVARKEALERA